MSGDDILNELITESREHLSAIEPDLLEMEQKGADVSDDLINRVFRAIHSIKGGFGFYGKKNIVELSHAMENVLSRLREKEIVVTPEITDSLLQGADKLLLLLDSVDSSDEMSIEEETTVLAPFLDKEKQKDSRAKKENKPADSKEEALNKSEESDEIKGIKEKHPDFTDEQIQDAVKNGQLIYQLNVDAGSDVFGHDKNFKELFKEWEKFGEIVSTLPERGSLEKAVSEKKLDSSEVSIIIKTVLEPDLIASALELPEEKIGSIDLSTYREKLKKESEKEEKEIKKSEKSTENKKKSGDKKSTNRIEEAVRVKTGLLNELMNYAGELVLARNQLMQTMQKNMSGSSQAASIVKSVFFAVSNVYEKHCRKNMFDSTAMPENYKKEIENAVLNAMNFSVSDLYGFNSISQNIDMVTSVLQENIMKTRLQPVSVVFSKFPRVIRDLARKLDKKIELSQSGQEVELDKTIIELLSDPLTHLVRNSADHGIEKPDVRLEKGKPESGKISLKAYQEGGKVFIEISDDGAGINVERVKNKAVEKGLLNKEEFDKISERDARQFIFAPGFSSAAQVSSVSGRGVGMDVVKTNIEKLGGAIEVESGEGKGTKVILSLPLTLAIIPSLVVVTEGMRFAIPQVGLEELVRIRSHEITKKVERINSAEVLRLRGTLLPLVRLSSTLGLKPTFSDRNSNGKIEDRRSRWSDRRGTPDMQQAAEIDVKERRKGAFDRRSDASNALKIAVLRVDKNIFGLVVDDVLESEEIVVKPLPGYLKNSMCFSGATIMGDGRVAMILDPAGIMSMAGLKSGTMQNLNLEEKQRKEKEETNSEKSANMLLFNIGGPERLAVSLSDVVRIEKRKTGEIETAGEQEFIQYSGKSMRLYRFERYLPVKSESRKTDEMFVIIPKNTEHPVGFIAESVEDTVQASFEVDKDAVSGTGIKGSSIVNKKMTLLLDINEILENVS